MQNHKSIKIKNGMVDVCKDAAALINKKSIDEYEIYAVNSIQNEIEIFNSNVDKLSFSDSTGIGIRVFKNGSIGYSYTAILESDSIEDCIEKAIINSRITNSENYNSLPKESEFIYKQKVIKNELLYRDDILKYSTADKIEVAKKLEILTKEKDKRIVSIDNLIYEDSLSEVAILNSHGFCDTFKATTSFIYVNAISRQKGDISTGDYFSYCRSPKDFNLEDIAAEAVKKSVSLLGGKKIKTQRCDLVLDPLVASQFLGIIAGTLTADSVQKGKSLFKDRIGDRIFTIDLDIFDYGTMPEGLATAPFDGEGVPGGKTTVFKDGILKTFLYNTYTARKDNKYSTGNAARASYRSTPGVGLSNFYISPSKESNFDKLVKSIDKGFYVSDIIGLHSGTNPISGEISVGAKGLWIEKGSLGFPVKEVTIASDILSFCSSIDKIGNDIKFLPSGGYIGSPSIVIRDIAVGGS